MLGYHANAARRKVIAAIDLFFKAERASLHKRFLSRLAAGTALAGAASAAQAGSPAAIPATMLPQGGHFVAGTGSIGTQGLTETITQSSQRGIIDFSSFSIGKSGTVKVNNGAGAPLDRVTGSNLSTILGTLSATGSVYLVNPQGVVVGKSGVVTTDGSFVAFDEKGNPLGSLIGFNSSFIEECRTRANLAGECATGNIIDTLDRQHR
jgi:filamentous hemagglutinin family protein